MYFSLNWKKNITKYLSIRRWAVVTGVRSANMNVTAPETWSAILKVQCTGSLSPSSIVQSPSWSGSGQCFPVALAARSFDIMLNYGDISRGPVIMTLQYWLRQLPGALLLLRLPLRGQLMRLSATPYASHAQSGEEGRLLLQRLLPQIWLRWGSCSASPESGAQILCPGQ